MNGISRVLLVEDNPGDVALIKDMLERADYAAYTVDSEARLATAIERISHESYDIILLDLGLPDSMGLETLSGMRQATDVTPIVVLTGDDNDRTGLAAIRKGAQDYVVKGQVRGDALQRALRYAIERESARKGLHASQELLRAVIDNIPDAIYVKDAEGRKVLANRADVIYVGANDEAAVLGKTDLELLPTELATRTDADDRGVILTGTSVIETEERGTSADGRLTWGLTSKIPLRDSEGHVTGLVGISRDITRRKIDEERAALSRDVLECLNRYDGEQDAIGEILQLVKDSTGIEAVGIRLRDGEDFPYYQTNGFGSAFVDAERSLCARDETGSLLRDAAGQVVLKCMCGNTVCGRTEPTLSYFTEGGSFWTNGISDLLAITSVERQQRDRWDRCAREGFESMALIPLRIQSEIIGLLQLNDRRQGQFTAESVQFFEGLGASIGVAFSRMRTTVALRQSEERYRTILETALDGTWLVDANMRLLEVNEAYCRMSGYSREELLSMRVSDLEAAETADATLNYMRETMLRGWGRFESRHVRKDGSHIDVELGVRYSSADGGRAIAFVRDITDRKQAEAERVRLDEQLRQSQKMEAVGQLAGGVAHDLNNMLGVINGYAEITLQGLQPSDQLYADIGEIRKAGDRSAQLTRQLLAFARRQAIAPRVLDLNIALEGMLGMLRRLVGENITLVWKPGARLWTVKIDPGQVDQILANLVVNARDAITGVGTVTIETENGELDDAYCRSHVGSAPGPYVSIAVTDDGCGMGEEILKHIFEPFFTTKPVGQGTGLGLATVYGITKQNCGNIYVYSEPGQGTTFRIYLPRYEAEGRTTAVDAELAQAPRGTETVLVVEDEASLLQLCRRVLEQLGYSVLTAGTPHDGLRLAAEHQGEIDLLLTDVVMPGMGGRQLQEILAATSPEVRHLFMSGYAAGALTQQGVQDGDPNLLQKPFTRMQIARRVREALDRH
jgi:PAS domain S-box-containing protein